MVLHETLVLGSTFYNKASYLLSFNYEPHFLILVVNCLILHQNWIVFRMMIVTNTHKWFIQEQGVVPVGKEIESESKHVTCCVGTSK